MRLNLQDPTTINRVFNSRQFSEAEAQQAQNIRDAAKEFTYAIVTNSPACADQSAAIRHVREAMFTAVSAIALKGDI